MKSRPRIEFTPQFSSQRKHASLAIKQALRETLELFEEDPLHVALRNHALKGKYQDFRSIDVTEDWRALYRIEPERIILVALGTHEMLYGKD